MAFGVALSVKATLGVSPISCIPYVYSLKYPLSMGEMTIAFNILLILLQIVVLGKAYKPFQLIQLPVVLIFGCFTDIALYLVKDLQASNYAWQLALCLSSCVVIGFSVFLEVKAKVTYLAGEGLALALAERFNIEFGKSKIGTDSTMVLICLISSFVLLGHLVGVREGTIAAAVLVGYLARFFSRKLTFLDALTEAQKSKAILASSIACADKRKLIITISREFGSGGREIGRLVADKLGLHFYDKELIRLTAEKSGFTSDYISEHEQRLANILLFSLYDQNYAYVNEQRPPLDALFLVQSKLLRDISEKESCVIVGRCADFVLKDIPGCFNVFIHANEAFRKERYILTYGGHPETVDKELEKINHERVNYCKYFTGRERGISSNYDLTLDSSLLGIDRSVQLIVDAVNLFVISQQHAIETKAN